MTVAFSKNKNAIYFLATEESELQNRKAFKDTVADFCENELLFGINRFTDELIELAKKRGDVLLCE